MDNLCNYFLKELHLEEFYECSIQLILENSITSRMSRSSKSSKKSYLHLITSLLNKNSCTFVTMEPYILEINKSSNYEKIINNYKTWMVLISFYILEGFEIEEIFNLFEFSINKTKANKLRMFEFLLVILSENNFDLSELEYTGISTTIKNVYLKNKDLLDEIFVNKFFTAKKEKYENYDIEDTPAFLTKNPENIPGIFEIINSTTKFNNLNDHDQDMTLNPYYQSSNKNDINENNYYSIFSGIKNLEIEDSNISSIKEIKEHCKNESFNLESFINDYSKLQEDDIVILNPDYLEKGCFSIFEILNETISEKLYGKKYIFSPLKRFTSFSERQIAKNMVQLILEQYNNSVYVPFNLVLFNMAMNN